MRKLIKKILNENEWEWAINSKPTWSTYYTSLLNEIKKLPNNLEDVTLKMLEPIWMRLSTTNKLLKKGVEPQEIDTDLAIEYMIDDPWPDKKVLLPDNDAIDIIENLFIRLMRVVEGGTENSNGKKYNDAYMTSQQSIYTSTKLTLITYINGLISQLTLINESDDLQWIKDIPAVVDITPGMCLRDQQGSQWDVHNFPTSEFASTDKNKWVWLIRTHTEGQKIIRRHPHPFKRVNLNDRLVVGDLSICDNTLKESDDLQWIRDIKPSIPFEEAKVGHHYNINITNVDGFNKALDDCEELFDIDRVVQAKVLLGSMEQYHSIYCYDNDFIPYWPSKKFSLNLKLLDGNGKQLLRHWFASGDLIQLQEQ